MFEKRSYEKELMDDLDLASDALEQNLKELEIINTSLGGYKVTLDALNRHRNRLPSDQIHITDIGSGAGDMLKKMALWGRKHKLNLKLTGIDANAFMIHYATERSREFREIDFRQANIFDLTPEDLQTDVLTMNLFCHHFTDDELMNIFRTIAKSGTKLLIINDLHRHPLAYYSIMALTRIFKGSYLVQNDAPLSVLRGFKRNELEKLFVETEFRKVELRWFWAFRWQLCAFGSELESNTTIKTTTKA